MRMIALWKRHIGLRILADLVGGILLELDEQRAQLPQLLFARALGGQARRQALDRRPHRDHLDHFALGLAHHIDAAPRDGAHEALLLEHAQRFADGGAAHAEFLRQLAFVEADFTGAAVDVHLGDGALDGIAGEPAQLTLT